MYYIYLLLKDVKNISIFRDVFYVGITKDISMRLSSHLRKSDQIIKDNYINKYGMVPIVLWSCENENDAKDREIFLIRYFGKVFNGGQLSNYSDGGDYASGNALQQHEIKFHLEEIKRLNISIRKYCITNNISRRVLGVANINNNTLKIKQKKYFNEEQILFHLNKCEISNISLYEYSKINNIEYSSIKRWSKKYTNYNKSTKLSQDKIDDIIIRYKNKESIRSISRNTGASRETVKRVIA